MTPVDIARQMEEPITLARSMGQAVQCLAESIDHDPRLSEAFDGVGQAIRDAMEQLEAARWQIIKG